MRGPVPRKHGPYYSLQRVLVLRKDVLPYSLQYNGSMHQYSLQYQRSMHRYSSCSTEIASAATRPASPSLSLQAHTPIRLRDPYDMSGTDIACPVRLRAPYALSGTDIAYAPQAVSYTHLTLPTICSV
eukprot:3610304-Rhodomonas_salina.1